MTFTAQKVWNFFRKFSKELSQILERAYLFCFKLFAVYIFVQKYNVDFFAEERKETKSLPQILKKYKDAIENILKTSVKNLWYFFQGGSPVYYSMNQWCRNRGGQGGHWPPQYLADQLTLFQRERADYTHLDVINYRFLTTITITTITTGPQKIFTFWHHCIVILPDWNLKERARDS